MLNSGYITSYAWSMNLPGIKNKAIQLRKQGFSLQEIAKKLHIAKSTSSLWVRKVELSSTAQNRLLQKQIQGRNKAIEARLYSRQKQIAIFQKKALESMQLISYSPILNKLICALLWWCEGNKNESYVRFTSSDETLIKNFLNVFRSGFSLDEKKFRCLIHIHSYHDDYKQKRYWSNVTSIPLSQFHNSFKKNNTGKRKHENYPGCIAVTYYDAKIAKELEAIYNAFTLNLN